MGSKFSKTNNKQSNELTKDDLFAIFLFAKTSSTGINMFERADFYKDFTKDDLISSIKSIIYNSEDIDRIANTKHNRLFVRQVLYNNDIEEIEEEEENNHHHHHSDGDNSNLELN